MANIFDWDISYITEAELRDTTTKTDLKALTDPELKIIISQAENVINNYIGYSFDMSKESEEVQKDIKIASFFVSEKIFENGDLIRGASSSGGEIRNQKVWDIQIVYSQGSTSNNTLDILWIPTQAKAILDRYKQNFFQQVL